MTFTMCRDLHKQREDGPSKKSSISPSLHSLVFAFICHFFISILKLERHWLKLRESRRSQEVIWTLSLESCGQVCGWINPKTTYKNDLRAANNRHFRIFRVILSLFDLNSEIDIWNGYFSLNMYLVLNDVCVCNSSCTVCAPGNGMNNCFVEERLAGTFLYFVWTFDFHLVNYKVDENVKFNLIYRHWKSDWVKSVDILDRLVWIRFVSNHLEHSSI